MSKRRPLKIDMCAASELRDTQGEMLSVEGADITELQLRGRLNDNHGKGFFNSIGRVTSAKKIFKKEDCENERHEYYWDKIKAPYIYVAGELFDNEDHPNARSTAAVLRHVHKADVPLKVKASVEGGVIARGIKDPSLLARTKIHSVAITMTPANQATLVEPINLDKTASDWDTDLILIKSVMHLAETNVPSFRHIVRDASATKVQRNLTKLVDLMKELGIEGEIQIPSKQKILQKALEQKILNNVEEIYSKINALKQEELEKASLKNTLAAAGMAAGISLSPSSASNKDSSIKAIPTDTATTPLSTSNPSHKEVYARVAKQYPLLGAIGMKESSGGINLDHSTMKSGMHKGHTAGGPWGMMPHSAAFTIKQDKELAQKYPEIANAALDVEKHHKDITKALNSNPELAADFAISAFKHRKDKTKNDSQLVYSWLNGLKGSWDKYKEGGKQALDEHQYVKDVMKEHDRLKPQKQERKPALNKALTAGYGGAGAPSSRVGGSVIQSESVEQGRPGFKYITCDSCGNEQIYSKNQVKCRNCGHNMSFEKLYRVMCSNK